VSVRADTLRAGGPVVPARPFAVARARTGRRLLVDRLARSVVKLGGAAIIVSILAILVVIAVEVYPLFQPPTMTPVRLGSGGGGASAGAASPVALFLDEHRELGVVVTATGIELFRVADGAILPAPRSPAWRRRAWSQPPRPTRGILALGLSDGRVLPVEVKFEASFPDGRRRVEAVVTAGDPIVVDPRRRPAADGVPDDPAPC
jgi:phosphate transport system permease protein